MTVRPMETLSPGSISVVVPVYNSEQSLPQLVSRLEQVLSALTSRFEIILVNDGAADRSWEVICALASERNSVRGIDLMRNYGQHNALLAGIRAAECEITVTLDDDLQNPPEEIPKLLEKMSHGYDVVYGRPDHEKHGFWRNLASTVTKLALQNAMGAKTASQVSTFRALRTDLREAFSKYESPFVSIDVLLTWGTARFAAIEVRHDARPYGRSNYTFRNLLAHASNMITGFTIVPLQLASLIGFAFTLFGFGVLVYVIGRYLIEGRVVPGFAFLASIIALFSGAQLFALGIIGEYLARMHFRTMERPPYAVRREVTSRGDRD